MTWSVILTDSQGTTRDPDVLSAEQAGIAPAFTPSVNALPSVTIPIKRDESFQESRWEDAAMTVTVDGDTLPIEQLEDVELRPEATILTGRGGVELRSRVQAQYDAAEVHAAAETLLSNNTSYSVDVATPPTATDAGVTAQSASTDAEWETLLPSNGPTATDPYEVSGGDLSLLQTAFTTEAEASVTRTNASTVSDSSIYSNGEAVELASVGDFVEFDFTTEYALPPGAPRAAVAVGKSGGIPLGHEFDILLDGYRIGGAVQGFKTLSDLFWIRTEAQDLYLEAGDHTLRMEVTALSEDNVPVDVLAPFDDRYGYTFDTTLNSDDALAGPEFYPGAVNIPLSDAEVTRSVPAAEITVSVTDATNEQAIALSSDRGETYDEATNATTHSVTFADRGATVRGRLTLSRFGSASSTPATGINGQSASEVTINADLEDMPLIVSERFDGQLSAVLSRFSETVRGDFAWGVVRNSASDIEVEFAQTGQRTASDDPAIETYDVRKTTAEGIQRAVVKGGTQRQEDRVRADLGTSVALTQDNLLRDSEEVVNADDGTRYERGSDYAIDYDAGDVTAQSNGTIADGDRLDVAYRFVPQGAADDGSANPRTDVLRIPPLATDRGCRLAAERIVAAASMPQYEGSLTIPGDETGFSVVEDINPSDVPTNGETLLIRSVESAVGTTAIQLENRASAGEIVSDLRTRVESVSERV
jgi:hypothetical protein